MTLIKEIETLIADCLDAMELSGGANMQSYELEYLCHCHVYEILYSSLFSSDLLVEKAHAEKTRCLRKRLAVNFSPNISIIQAVEELRKIVNFLAPLSKCRVLQRVVQLLEFQNTRPVDIDTLFPALLRVVLEADVEELHSHLQSS